MGACAALTEGDTMTCTYRGHGAVLAMGAPLDRSMAEILGRAGGLCAGKGGSMHLTDVSVGALGSFAVVGAHLPFACGTALAAQTLGTGAVSLCFFGDGATNIGAFHEAMNLASVWKLPVVFVCENNLYGEYSPLAVDDRRRAAGRPGHELRDGRGAGRRQRRAGRARRGRRRLRAGPGGRRADVPRGAHLPAHGPLPGRPRRLPAAGRARPLARARPDRALRTAPAAGRAGAARPARRGRAPPPGRRWPTRRRGRSTGPSRAPAERFKSVWAAG